MEKAGIEYHEETVENIMNEPPRHLGVVRNKLELPESELAKDQEIEQPPPKNGKLGRLHIYVYFTFYVIFVCHLFPKSFF